MRSRYFPPLFLLTVILLFASLLASAHKVSFHLEEENGQKVFRLKVKGVGPNLSA